MRVSPKPAVHVGDMDTAFNAFTDGAAAFLEAHPLSHIVGFMLLVLAYVVVGGVMAWMGLISIRDADGRTGSDAVYDRRLGAWTVIAAPVWPACLALATVAAFGLGLYEIARKAPRGISRFVRGVGPGTRAGAFWARRIVVMAFTGRDVTA